MLGCWSSSCDLLPEWQSRDWPYISERLILPLLLTPRCVPTTYSPTSPTFGAPLATASTLYAPQPIHFIPANVIDSSSTPNQQLTAELEQTPMTDPAAPATNEFLSSPPTKPAPADGSARRQRAQAAAAAAGWAGLTPGGRGNHRQNIREAPPAACHPPVARLASPAVDLSRWLLPAPSPPQQTISLKSQRAHSRAVAAVAAVPGPAALSES